MSLSSHNEDFFLKVREPEAQAMERWGGRGLWRTCFVTVSQRRVAMKVGSVCLCLRAAEAQPDRRASTAFLIDPGIGTAAGIGYHRPVPFRNKWNTFIGYHIRIGRRFRVGGCKR